MKNKVGFLSMMLLLAFAGGVIIVGCGNDLNGTVVGINPTSTVTVGPGSPGSPNPTVTVTSTPQPPAVKTFLLTENANGFAMDALKLSNGNFSPASLPFALPQPTALPTAPQFGIAANANGIFAYAVNGSNQIVGAKVGSGLSPVEQVTTVSGNAGRACVIDPSGKFLYVTTTNGGPSDWELFKIDQTAGTLTTLPKISKGNTPSPNATSTAPGVTLTPAPTAPVTGIACKTIGTAEVLVASLGTKGTNNVISEVINPADGTFSATHAVSVGAVVNTDIPTSVTMAAIGGNTYAYVTTNQGDVYTIQVGSDGTLTSKITGGQQVFLARGALASAVGVIAGVPVLYVISDAVGASAPPPCTDTSVSPHPNSTPTGNGQLGAFSIITSGTNVGLLGDGSANPPTITTNSGSNVYSNTGNGDGCFTPLSVAVDPSGQFVLMSTQDTCDTSPAPENLFIFDLAQTGSIGNPATTPSQTAVNDGDPILQSPSGPGTLTLFQAAF